MFLMGCALALSLAGNAFLSHLYIGELEDHATTRQAYKSFSDGVKVVGEEQNARAVKQTLQDIKAKERSDEDHANRLAAANRTIDELRQRTDESAGRWKLRPAPAGSNRPDLACYDRADLEREERESFAELSKETRELSREGTKNTLDLNVAKDWAQKRVSP